MIDSNHNHAMQPAIQDGSGHASALTNQPAKPGEGKTQDTPWSDRFIAPEDEADDDEEENGGSKLGPEAQLGIAEVAKKKNKKKKPKSKRGLVGTPCNSAVRGSTDHKWCRKRLRASRSITLMLQ